VRTTVTLDPDTEHVVRHRMEVEGVSFKVALNDAIRDGARHRPRVDSFRTTVFDLGEPAVDLTHAMRVAADLEDEAILQRLQADG
jgi:hypothetical protein